MSNKKLLTFFCGIQFLPIPPSCLLYLPVFPLFGPIPLHTFLLSFLFPLMSSHIVLTLTLTLTFSITVLDPAILPIFLFCSPSVSHLSLHSTPFSSTSLLSNMPSLQARSDAGMQRAAQILALMAQRKKENIGKFKTIQTQMCISACSEELVQGTLLTHLPFSLLLLILHIIFLVCFFFYIYFITSLSR